MMRKRLIYLGIVAQCCLSAFAQPDLSTIQSVESENVYVDLLSTLSVANAETSANEIAIFLGAKLSPIQQLRIAETLSAMRKKGKATPEAYKAYVKSLESILNSALILSQNLEHVMHMQRRAAETHNYKNYLRVLRYLETLCEERMLYRTPYQTWYLEDGSIDFSFEESNTTAAVQAASSSPSQEDERWQAQEIQDWGATNIDDIEQWGRSTETRPSASAINKEVLYNKFTFTPLPALALGATLHIKNVSLSVVSGRKTSEEALESQIYTSISADYAKLSILGKQMHMEKTTMPWPATDEYLKAGQLTLDYLDAHLPSGRLQSQAAHLSLQEYLHAEKGFFEATTDPRGRLVPTFRSYRTNVSLQLPYQTAVSYKGGLSVHNTTILGASATHTPGTLTITNSKGYTIQAKDKLFRFLPEKIISHHSEILINHGSGTIDHPQVHLNYEDPKKRLFILRQKGNYKNTPFLATHVGMYMKVDAMTWYINQHQLSLNMHRAKNAVPASFESVNYFSPIRYKRIPSILPFHPLLAVVKYAKEHFSNTFLIYELSSTYKLPIKQLRSGIRFLAQQRYIHYDETTGAITVLDKAFHYVFSNIAKNDYDHLLIPSRTLEGPNAVLDLEKNEINIKGVEKIYFTDDLQVFIKPENQEVRLQGGRNLTFNGELHSSTIKYKGKDFFFNYEDYTVQMSVINEMTFQVKPKRDSLEQRDYTPEEEYNEVENGKLEELGGLFYIAHPDQKSGRQKNPSYPKFVSSDDAIVYFDSPKILGGAYDRSIKFITPPFSVDSINSANFTVVGFEGEFVSGGIFPGLDLKLALMKDNSLGFKHKILSAPGYPIYGKEQSTLKGDIRLDFGGIQGTGILNHYTTTLHSDKFVFYQDKTVAEVEQGEVKRGNIDLAGHESYPALTFQHVRLLFQPAEDNMLLKTTGEPINMYEGLMSLTGILNIKKTGAFAAGAISTVLVEARSKYFHLKDHSFSARQTNFNILSDDPEKHAVEGTRIDIRYDISKNIAYMTPEREGTPSIDFPYIHMRTSIHDAIWNHSMNTIHMTNPPGTDLEYSFFETTFPDEPSLRFQAAEATYFMDSLLLHIKGVPYVRILGVDIVPYDSQLVVGADADIRTLTEATLHINSDNQYHTLTNGEIKIHSAEKFTGTAKYQHITSSNDTFYIAFDEFLVEEIRLRNRNIQKVIVAESEILETDEFKTSEGFFFKGNVKMYGHRKHLFFNGAVSLALVDSHENQWINYTSSGRDEDILIDFDNTRTNIGQALTAGLYYGFEYTLEVPFMEDVTEKVSWQIFKPTGFLSFNEQQNLYVIEPRDISKRLSSEERETLDEADEDFFDEEVMYIEEDEETEEDLYYEDLDSDKVYFHTFRYSPRSQDIIFRGPLALLKDETQVMLHIAAEGKGNIASNNIEIEGIFSIDFNLPKSILRSITENIELAKDELLLDEVILSTAFEQQLSTLVKPKAMARFSSINPSDIDAAFLYTLSPLLKTNFLFSELSMHWDAHHASWYSTGPLHLLHIEGAHMYTSMQGHFQITPGEISNHIELFLHLAPNIWYHISYREKNLKVYGSTSDFNTLLQKATKGAVATPDYYSFTMGDEEGTRAFLNEFHRVYARKEKVLEVNYPVTLIDSEDETYTEEENSYEEETDEYYEEDSEPTPKKKRKDREEESQYYEEETDEYYEEDSEPTPKEKKKRKDREEESQYYEEEVDEYYEEDSEPTPKTKKKRKDREEETEESQYYEEETDEYYEEEVDEYYEDDRHK